MDNSTNRKPRARELGIPFDGTPGRLNAITDVQGVEVGHTTLISGSGKLVVGEGPVRTGVTAIFPCGKQSINRVFAAWFSLNGYGEMTGTAYIEESGLLEGPIMLTNTHSVGVVRDSVIEWQVKQGLEEKRWFLPVVAETFDGELNDINGFHIKKPHVFNALESARPGPVAEGSVGGGTGMICFGFKGGIGTASRQVRLKAGNYLLGVLVQANFGRCRQLRIAGVPVGAELSQGTIQNRAAGSIIIVVATDAPLLPHQLKRLARRVSIGLGRTGSIAASGSGDIFITFSTANAELLRSVKPAQVSMMANEQMNPLFEATIQATEEAIINSMIAAETMVGRDNNRVKSIPHDRLKDILKKHGRLLDSH